MEEYLEIVTPYGYRYLVNEAGQMIRRDTTSFQPSGEWIFAGMVSVRRSGWEPDITRERLFEMTTEELAKFDFRYKNGNPKFTGSDIDHGTHRVWGNVNVHGIQFIRKVTL